MAASDVKPAAARTQSVYFALSPTGMVVRLLLAIVLGTLVYVWLVASGYENLRRAYAEANVLADIFSQQTYAPSGPGELAGLEGKIFEPVNTTRLLESMDRRGRSPKVSKGVISPSDPQAYLAWLLAHQPIAAGATQAVADPLSIDQPTLKLLVQLSNRMAKNDSNSSSSRCGNQQDCGADVFAKVLADLPLTPLAYFAPDSEATVGRALQTVEFGDEEDKHAFDPYANAGWLGGLQWQAPTALSLPEVQKLILTTANANLKAVYFSETLETLQAPASLLDFYRIEVLKDTPGSGTGGIPAKKAWPYLKAVDAFQLNLLSRLAANRQVKEARQSLSLVIGYEQHAMLVLAFYLLLILQGRWFQRRKSEQQLNELIEARDRHYVEVLKEYKAFCERWGKKEKGKDSQLAELLNNPAKAQARANLMANDILGGHSVHLTPKTGSDGFQRLKLPNTYLQRIRRRILTDESKPSDAKAGKTGRQIHGEMLPYKQLREISDRLGYIGDSNHVDNAREIITHLSAQQRRKVYLSRWVIRWGARALPAIGFVGTVRGILIALSNADSIVRAASAEGQAAAITAVSATLGLSFATTFIALILGLAFSIFDDAQKNREMAFVEETSEALEPLIDAKYAPSQYWDGLIEEGKDPEAPVKQAEEKANGDAKRRSPAHNPLRKYWRRLFSAMTGRG